jgi:hypothetical protein
MAAHRHESARAVSLLCVVPTIFFPSIISLRRSIAPGSMIASSGSRGGVPT